jgi:hypothetical protein
LSRIPEMGRHLGCPGQVAGPAGADRSRCTGHSNGDTRGF